MSLPLEQLKDQTLKRLDIPNKTVESPQGLNTLYLQKLLNLVYVANSLEQLPHLLDSRAASDVGSGARFTAPIDARRIVFSMAFTYTATATAGTRTPKVRRQNKAGTIVNAWIDDSLTASQAERYELGPASATASAATIILNYPVMLMPEWYVAITDGAAIDTADDVAWEIEYLEIPI